MSRNDQVIRQWHILRLLESREALSISELMGEIHPDYECCERTIRRDLEALQSAGFPLYSERINNRVRWRLLESFKNIPSLPLTPTELIALYMGRDLLKPLEGTQFKDAIESLYGKIRSIVPHNTISHLTYTLEHYAAGIPPYKDYRSHKMIIDTITQAIQKQRCIKIRYFSLSQNQETRREVDPYKIWYYSGSLYLIAYCHQRKEIRTFAVDRIRDITLTENTYQKPLDFSFEEYMDGCFGVIRGERVEVEVLFEADTARWVKEKIWHPTQKIKELGDGKIVMSLMVADTVELKAWILSFGSGAKVIKPQSLAKEVKKEARKISSLYKKSPRK
ncbi:MAG: transcriptional regulator [Nitrospirota bacterium]